MGRLRTFKLEVDAKAYQLKISVKTDKLPKLADAIQNQKWKMICNPNMEYVLIAQENKGKMLRVGYPDGIEVNTARVVFAHDPTKHVLTCVCALKDAPPSALKGREKKEKLIAQEIKLLQIADKVGAEAEKKAEAFLKKEKAKEEFFAQKKEKKEERKRLNEERKHKLLEKLLKNGTASKMDEVLPKKISVSGLKTSVFKKSSSKTPRQEPEPPQSKKNKHKRHQKRVSFQV
eukprot:TRINITY_DN6457_c0_g1_i1.p1 TRINITY_DN6457_c0_g1~~TRINITY_DN6457_c0_g1_i1.p1  ORF type:complete len:232 (+),score=87.78 TRINITY_DN6457_c0_g1_i1:38-733(+)